MKKHTLRSALYSEIRKRKFNSVLITPKMLSQVNDKSYENGIVPCISEGAYSKIAKWNGFNWLPMSEVLDGNNVYHTYLRVFKN